MEIFSVALAVIAILVAGFSISEIRHDQKERKKAAEELAVAMKEAGNAMVSLSETHNTLVKAQMTIDTRLETMELTIQSLRHQMPSQRRI